MSLTQKGWVAPVQKLLRLRLGKKELKDSGIFLNVQISLLNVQINPLGVCTMQNLRRWERRKM
jgi:hypothetical protein